MLILLLSAGAQKAQERQEEEEAAADSHPDDVKPDPTVDVLGANHDFSVKKPAR